MNIHSLSAYLKRLRSTATFDPVRDWLTLLSVSILALAAIIVWNVWAFGTVAAGGTIGVPAAKAPTILNNSSLETVHAIFQKRAAEEEKYVQGSYRYADPSQ